MYAMFIHHDRAPELRQLPTPTTWQIGTPQEEAVDGVLYDYLGRAEMDVTPPDLWNPDGPALMAQCRLYVDPELVDAIKANGPKRVVDPRPNGSE